MSTENIILECTQLKKICKTKQINVIRVANCFFTNVPIITHYKIHTRERPKYLLIKFLLEIIAVYTQVKTHINVMYVTKVLLRNAL